MQIGPARICMRAPNLLLARRDASTTHGTQRPLAAEAVDFLELSRVSSPCSGRQALLLLVLLVQGLSKHWRCLGDPLWSQSLAAAQRCEVLPQHLDGGSLVECLGNASMHHCPMMIFELPVRHILVLMGQQFGFHMYIEISDSPRLQPTFDALWIFELDR